MDSVLFKFMVACHRLVKGVANRVLDKSEIRPRNFSNKMLRKYASYFSGDIINVSGWKDGDGEGGQYREYFKDAGKYFISNVAGQEKGFGSAEGYREYNIDLTEDLPGNLVQKFDVVFNHTTLEHIYNLKKAFDNLCKLSKDAVIIVVPVMQQIHHMEDFGDYWRPTTMAIAKMFVDNGLEPLVIKCNDQPFAPVYCFAIASRHPEKYKDKFDRMIDFEMGKYNYGSSLKEEYVDSLIR